MIIHDCVQNSKAWFAARCGVVTSSNFSKVITGGGKKSDQVTAFENRIVAEILTGNVIDDFKGNHWTERGHELEPEAVEYYEFTKEVETQTIGFITDDAGKIGASPDRLIGDDGILEGKCLAPHTHVELLLNITDVSKRHYPQLQGQLYVTGRRYVDIIFYYPMTDKLPPVIIRVDRDEEYLKTMEELLSAMWIRIDGKIKTIERITAGGKTKEFLLAGLEQAAGHGTPALQAQWDKLNADDKDLCREVMGKLGIIATRNDTLAEVNEFLYAG